jgi:hypothetical protein
MIDLLTLPYVDPPHTNGLGSRNLSPDPLRCLEFKRSFHPVGIWGQAISGRTTLADPCCEELGQT